MRITRPSTTDWLFSEVSVELPRDTMRQLPDPHLSLSQFTGFNASITSHVSYSSGSPYPSHGRYRSRNRQWQIASSDARFLGCQASTRGRYSPSRSSESFYLHHHQIFIRHNLIVVVISFSLLLFCNCWSSRSR